MHTPKNLQWNSVHITGPELQDAMRKTDGSNMEIRTQARLDVQDDYIRNLNGQLEALKLGVML